MHWTEQTETMVKAQAETQKQMWKNWFALMPGVPSPAAVYLDVANQISEEAAEGFKAQTAESEQVVKDVAERLLTTQNQMLRILELSLRAWKAIAPKDRIRRGLANCSSKLY